MTGKYFPNTLPTDTAKLVAKFQSKSPSFLDTFYLSGGTALSLQLGHRESEDLDFFSPSDFDPLLLQKQLTQFGQLSQTMAAEGTLNTFLGGVKLQFLEYPYTMLESFNNWQRIHLSSVLDIACTKLQTIGMRGSKKDFIDLYFLLEKYSLPDLLSAMGQKYAQIEYSQTHILKSLLYFEDAENQPLPRMHIDVSWEDVKQKMMKTVKEISFK